MYERLGLVLAMSAHGVGANIDHVYHDPHDNSGTDQRVSRFRQRQLVHDKFLSCLHNLANHDGVVLWS